MMFSAASSDTPSGVLLSVVAIIVGLASYAAYRTLSPGRPLASLPPGPRPLPLIGNLLDLPRSHPWVKFSEWGDIYGGIVHVSSLGQSIIILNEPKYAIDMLDKKGALYGDRPTLVMGGQLVGWDQSPALIPFGDQWSEYRRLFSHFMGTKAKVDAYNPILHEETNVYLKHILATPHDWIEHTRHFAGGLILQLAYGYRASDPGGKGLIKLADDAMEGFSEAITPNAFLVDVLPILRYVPYWFPGAAWKHKAKLYHDSLQEMLRAPFELVQRQMAAGVARPSFTQNHLDGPPLTPEQERVVQWAAAGIYRFTELSLHDTVQAARTPSTVAGIECLFLGLTRHTAEQGIAQAELDAVLGHDCLPTLADRERLPYCEALYLEIMRRYTFNPLGLAHVAREDDVHDGVFIPKGSIIVPNNWRFFNDAKTYAQPETFTPERFLGTAKQYDPRKYLFGYGRRTCPGVHLADASMWLACLSILAVFNVAPPMKDGERVVPPANFTNSGISHPEPFECVVRPRNAGSEKLVHGLPGNF